jgi:acyl transferase domain-containing protein/SAM-dependent methyltransferase
MANDDQLDQLSPAKRAVYEIRKLRLRVEELERQRDEPVAIVGIGLRFPGNASTPGDFWDILAGGVDTVTEIPASRWPAEMFYDSDPDAPGKMYTRHGSFVADPALFDADFFGISPREAASLDPQHRLALEVAWEALENAGYNPAGLAQTDAGVFLALGNSDYDRMAFGRVADIDAYTSSGNLFSVAAGRISYTLGFEGPSVALDTACSGSLVAIHLACQSLRAGECGLALAGGVNLILSPEVNINFSKSRMLARDGRCKTFDIAADGYGRGEGCGLLVLKRLSDAEAGRDRILAVIRGSAVNQSGRSGGLTVPKGPAQVAVIRAALSHARMEPQRVGYVEAHGTGTSLGDPIEAHALVEALGANRSAGNPLIIGSVKTNVGHLEAAAGVAGLIKVVLALQHGEIPGNLHFKKLNPHIDWSGTPVEIPVNSRPWPAGPLARVAGVSSFGFCGANAHVIVEEAPQRASTAPQSERPLHILALSARSEAALNALRDSYANRLTRSDSDLADICYTANSGRAHFQERAVYLGASAAEMLGGATLRGTVQTQPDIAFLFPGEGAQYAGMGKEFYDTQPVFRRALDECAAHFSGGLKEPLADVLWGRATHLLHRTEYAQPAIFAIEYALFQLWTSWGIRPDAVLGHGAGEYAAATVAGVWSLADGLRLLTARAGLMAEPSGQSAMAAFAAAAAEIQYSEPQVTVASSVTGGITSPGEISNPQYWLRQATETVRVKEALRSLPRTNQRIFLEIGPGATLLELGRQCMRDERLVWLPSFLGHQDAWRQILDSLGRLYVTGANVDWAGFDAPYIRRKVALPTYPFERRRHWLADPQPSVGGAPPTWKSVLEFAGRQSQQCPMDLQVWTYAERWRMLDRLAQAYIVETLRGFGVFAQPAERHSAASLIRKLGISDVYLKLMERWLARLSAAGLVERIGGEYGAASPLPGYDLRALLAEARRTFAADCAFLDYVVRCGDRLQTILTGRASALETLFPGGDFAPAEDLYERAPLSRYFSAIARAAVDGFARSHRDTPLHVLEIGAGTGATTTAVLPVLDPATASYAFTDVSQRFLDHGARKFRAYPFVRFGIFDVGRSGAGQGYADSSYDVVLATNAIHATGDVRTALCNVRSLLAPGGIFVLGEATTYLPWFDVTTALIEGWQAFDDGLRDRHPLLSAADWQKALLAAGFQSCEAFPGEGSPAQELGQHVIVAQVSGYGARSAQTVVRRQAAPETSAAPAVDDADRLRQTAVPEQYEDVVRLVRLHISELLRMDSLDRVPRKRKLIDLGLDSLMAVELRDRIVNALGLREPLPATLVFDYPTPEAIAHHLWYDLLHSSDEAAPADSADGMASRAGEIEDLADEEVEALLRVRLQSL